MSRRIELRKVSTKEKQAVRRLARARKESVELVRRAQLIKYMMEHPEVPASRAGMRVGFGSNASGTYWVKRFNEKGVEGLQDKPRSGRPVTHTQEVRSRVIDLAVQKPSSLGYCFALWTLERLRVAMQERYEIRLARATIWRWLDDEGLEWKRQQSWFHEAEKHDPEFVEKRGPSSGHT